MLRCTTSLLAAGALSASAAGTARHVILVHGIWDHPWTLRRMERTLRESGLEPVVVTLTPNDGRAGLDTLALQMDEQIEAAVGPEARISIIGFSMGGLVARSWLRQSANPDRVDTLVTIASPHRGTWLAWLSGLPGVRDMRPGSAFLRALDADASRHERVKWVTIRSPLDLIIVPSTSSHLPWATNHIVPALAHPFLAWDGRTLARIVEALGVSTKSAPDEPASPREESPRPRIPGIRPRR